MESNSGSDMFEILDVQINQACTGSYLVADVLSAQDYYPGGSLLPGRTFTSNDYRYGYQGSEKDDEITGVTGAHITTTFRELDTRLLRWWSIDPKANASQSPYMSMGGNPIWNNDPFGDTVKYSGFKERFDVFVGRLFSKEFRQEHNILKESKDVFTYNRIPGDPTTAEGGNIELMGSQDYTLDGEIFSSRKFNLNYERSKRKTQLGQSPYHALFEETFHAADFTSERNFNMTLTPPDASGAQFIGSIHVDRSSEARAWMFAANNAPFALSVFDKRDATTGLKVRFTKPLIRQIRTATQGQVENWLFCTVGYS